jgi:hypothetical protein
MFDLLWSLVIAVVAMGVLGVAGFYGAMLALARPDHRNPFLRWFTDWYERSH